MAEDEGQEAEGASDSGVTVFISYSHKNTDLKRLVERALGAQGYKTLSDEDIVEGMDYRSDIARLIRSSSLTVVLWTHEAFTTRWVADEAHLADELANRDGRLRYIGVIIDPVLDKLPFPLTNRQNLNLTPAGLTADGLQRLVAVVARFAALQGHAAPEPAPTAQPTAPPPETVDDAAQELEFYTDALQAGTAQALRSYLTHYPKGAHRPDAEARLSALTSPVHRWRKRMIGGGAALAGALTLLFTGYPVIKELMLSSAAAIERAAEPAPSPAAKAPAPTPTPEVSKPKVVVAGELTPYKKIEACDLAAGSVSYNGELLALGRKAVPFDKIVPSVAIPACAEAFAVAPDLHRIVHALGRSYHAAGNTDSTGYFRAAELYEMNCNDPSGKGAPSCENLGGLYERAEIVAEADKKKALYYYQRACDFGVTSGCEKAKAIAR